MGTVRVITETKKKMITIQKLHVLQEKKRNEMRKSKMNRTEATVKKGLFFFADRRSKVLEFVSFAKKRERKLKARLRSQ